jgi:DNA invertase Pin-like site-specific DNA recombinase
MTPKPLKKAFGYLRVSSDGQVTGDGLERQRQAIKQYAAANGFRVVKFFSEEGVSGCTDSLDRPAYQEMLIALLSDGVRTVLIERMDRLARDVVVQEGILKDLVKRGFELVSVSEPDLCSSDPYRAAMRQMLGVFAELDRKTIVLKLRAARQRMRTKTGRCEGRKPYGEREGESEVVDLIRKLSARGMNYSAIANKLNADGVSTRYEGAKWYPANISRILSREKAA